MLGVGKDQSALYAETARRNLRDRIRGVSRFGGRFDRTADSWIETSDVAVKALGGSAFQLVPQADVQREPACHLPIVVKEGPVVQSLIRSRGVAIDESPSRHTEQERREFLTDGGSC